jgi:hypothetical protein
MLNNEKLLAVFLYVCEISRSHSGVSEDKGVMGYDAVSLGEWFPTFRKDILPLSSNVNRSKTNKEALRAFETSTTTCTTTRHIPEHLNPTAPLLSLLSFCTN